MYSFKLKTCGRESRPTGTLRSFLLLLAGLFAGHAVEAQTYNWKPVQIHGSGFVSGLLFHPNALGLMYCRTDIGGAYRWNPTNNSWIQLQDFLGFPNNEWNLISAESIGLDAQDTNRLYLSCGWLGSPNEIMVSTNRGATFARINSPFAIRANDDGRGTGERFGVDPNLGSTIFYGTRQDGLWKSVNYGANWAKVASFPVNTTANGVGLTFVEFIKNSGTPGSATPVIWVGVAQGGTNLFRSTDGGVTWTGLATNGVPTNCMPLRAAQDGLGNMYVTLCDGAGPNGISSGVVRKFNLTTLTSINVTPPTGQGGFGGVSVDRQNPNVVVVTTANRWWPLSDIYRSTNGGTNWSAVYSGTVDTSSGPYMNPNSGNVIQGWMFDIKIDPYNSNRVYYVTGGGVFSSYNFGNATPSWEFRSDGIEESAFTSVGMNLAVPPSGGPQLLSVFGDIGGFAHYNLDVSPPLTNLFYPNVGGNNYGINFAELSPNLVVRTYYNGTRGGYISTNSGSTWTAFPAQPAEVATNGPGTVVLSASGNRLVWTVPGVAPYYSTNQGVTWSPCAGSNLTPTQSWEEPYSFSDRVNPNKFYLYYRATGRVFVSTDGGASFNLATTITAWGDSMCVPFGYEGNLWVAIYDGLWRSTNSGASFFKVPGVQAAHTVGFGRTATGTGFPVVYLHGQIGGTWGIYRSENQGTNWTRINDNQHQYGNIQQVVGDPKIYGRCYIAAGGRGILYGDMPDQPPFTPTGLIATASNAVVQLSWNNAVGADSYLVKRSTTSGSGYTTIASGVTATSYLDTGVVNGTTYYYVIAATNNISSSADSAEASATPFAILKLAGTIIGTAGSYNNEGNTIAKVFDNDLNTFFDANVANGAWAGLDFGVGVSNIIAQIKYCPRAGGFADRMPGGVFQGANQANFSGAVTLFTITTQPPYGAFTSVNITNATAFRYVRYLSPNGGWGNVAEVEFWGPGAAAPAAPTGLAATAGNAQVALAWNASATATNYYVKRSTTSGSGYVNIATNASLTFTNTGLVNGTPYYYVVSAVNAGSESANSTQVSATPLAPPNAPGGLAATAGDASVALNWSVSATATNYYVKRSMSSGSGYATVGTNASLAFTNTGLNNGTLYFYVVSAVNASGEGGNSSEVSARPTSSASPQLGFTTAGNQLQLTWPADHTGWQLQAQTNDLATGLGANWSTVALSAQTNQITIPFDTTNDSVFYRLLRPY